MKRPWAGFPESSNGSTRTIIAILVNTLTFDAKWANVFWAERTLQPFYGRSGPQQVAMMTFTKEPIRAAAREGDDVIELSYQMNEFAMRIHVPRQGSAQDWMRQMSPEDWTSPLSRFYANLTMPRFELRASMELANLIPEALRRRADFGRLLRSPLPIVFPRMCQETWLQVDEWGTKAAAATACYLAAACDTPKPITLRIQEPFVFSIRHVPSHQALFTGWVDDFAS